MKHFDYQEPFSIGEKVYCFAPAGWGGTTRSVSLDECGFDGDGLDPETGLPMHGKLYCVRGFDHTVDRPAVYLVGIRGSKRLDGSEMSFGAGGFMRPSDFRRAVDSLSA